MPLRNLIIVAIAVLVSLACFAVAAKNRYANLFAEALEVVHKDALVEIPPQQLFTSAMDGMLEQIDEHSQFIAGNRFREFDEDMRQEFGGVGMYVEINPKNKRLFVLAPMPGTPAFAAGLQIGDEILEINGQNVEGKDRADAIKLLRGAINESVELTIDRAGKVFKKQIRRASINVPSISGDWRMPDGSWQFVLKEHPRIGYLRLSQFGDKSANEFTSAWQQINGNVDGLILDLRNNPGGLLSVAVEVCDMFIEPGQVIVGTRRRGGQMVNEIAMAEPIVQPNLPVVILVNRFSASASEIVAGCLQDHHRAIIIGEQTYGKGTVQDVIPMQRGTSALKLTTASYWRPSGKPIDRHDALAKSTKIWGVQPDAGFAVKLTEEDLFDDLRSRNIRDLEGLIPVENREMLAAIKRMQRQINQSDAAENSDSLAPAPDDSVLEKNDSPPTVPVEPPPSQPALQSEEVDDETDSTPHRDRTLERAIEYLQEIGAEKRIAG